MRKVLLVHISSSGCCNTRVTMLNNGDFGFPYCATPAFSTPAVWCRVFQSRVFQSRVFSRPALEVCLRRGAIQIHIYLYLYYYYYYYYSYDYINLQQQYLVYQRQVITCASS